MNVIAWFVHLKPVINIIKLQHKGIHYIPFRASCFISNMLNRRRMVFFIFLRFFTVFTWWNFRHVSPSFCSNFIRRNICFNLLGRNFGLKLPGSNCCFNLPDRF